MSDDQPRYGERATPEEQRRRAGLPDPLPVSEPSIANAAHSAPLPQPPQSGSADRRAGDGAEVAERPGLRWDRILTLGFLGYGLLNVIFTALSYIDPADVMNQTLRMLGVEDEFSNFAQGRLWGTIAAVVLVVGWTLTAMLAVYRLRRGAMAWWVPVVGAIVTTIAASLCLAVAMFGDPAFLSAVPAGS